MTLNSAASPSAIAIEVGRRIKEIRLRNGLSRHAFGSSIGVSGQQIHKYEIGKDSAPLYRLVTIANVYRVNPRYFWPDIPGTGPEVGSDASDSTTLQLVRAFRRIGNAKVRRLLLKFIEHMAPSEESASHQPREITDLVLPERDRFD